MDPIDELARRVVTRRQAMHGFGGLLAVGAFGTLLGCGSDDGGGATTAGGGGESASLDVWTYRPEYRQAIEGIDAAFERANPGISVQMVYKPAQQYDTVLRSAVVGGAAPDVFAVSGSASIAGDLGAGGGYLAPLDGAYDPSVLPRSIQSVVTVDGTIYAAPITVYKVGVYYQRAVFAEHGISEPTTWAELTDVSNKLKDAGVAAWSMPAQDMSLPFYFYHLAVNSILGDESVSALASGERRLTDPELLPAAQLMVDLADTYNKGFAAVGYAEGKALFAQGQSAMIIGGSSDFAGYQEIDPDIDVGFFGFPSPDGARDPVSLDGLSLANVVSRDSDSTEAAKTYVGWLTSEEAQQLVIEELGLPARTGIEPVGDTPRARILRTILAVDGTPTWADAAATANVYTEIIRETAGVFTDRLTPEQFAETAQRGVVVS